MSSNKEILIADASGRVISMNTPEEVTEEVSDSFKRCTKLLREDIRNVTFMYYCLARFFDEIEDCQLPKEERKKLFDDFFNYLQGDNLGYYGNFNKLVSVLSPSVKDPRRKIMVENFDGVIDFFNNLDEITKSQALECLNEQRYGMKSFLDKKVETMDDLSEYCYYVAGTVGLFLNQAMRAKRGADGIPSDELAKSFGTFLQIVNILRGIYGDLQEGRFYLPSKEFPGINVKEVIERIGKEGTLDSLSDKEEKSLNYGRDSLIYRTVKHLIDATNYIFSAKHADFKKFLIVAAADGSKRLEKMHDNLELFVQDEEIDYSTLSKLEIFARTKYVPFWLPFGYNERTFREKHVKSHISYLEDKGRKIAA